MKTIRVICYSLFLFFLAGCLVPERFSAWVEVRPNGSYTYSYKGTTVNAMAAAAIKQGGSLSPRDDADLKAESGKLAKVADVRKASYTGNGRYDLQIEGEKKPGEALKLFNFFTVTTSKDGVMTIASAEIKEKNRQELEQLGIKIDGTLEVKLPKNVEIISHNATSTPKFFGMFGAYSWRIGRADQSPVIKVRLKS